MLTSFLSHMYSVHLTEQPPESNALRMRETEGTYTRQRRGRRPVLTS